MATHSSFLAREIPFTEEPGGLQSTGSQSRTWLSTHTHASSYSGLSAGIIFPLKESAYHTTSLIWSAVMIPVHACSVTSAMSLQQWTTARQAPVYRIFQARILEWVGMPSSRGSCWPKDRTQASCIAGRLYHLSHRPSTYMIPILTWNYDCHFNGDHTQISIALPLVSCYLWVRISLDLNLTIKLMKQNYVHDFPGGSDGKASAYNAGDPGSIPGLGRSPGEGNGNPLQYSCLENPTDGRTWWATVHGVTESQTWLSDFTFTFMFISFEK